VEGAANGLVVGIPRDTQHLVVVTLEDGHQP
jgi:hypothetical protein